MTSPAAEIANLTPNLRLWHRFDASVKADLFSTALTTAEGMFLIDPISLPLAAIQEVVGDEKVAGIFVTNANHDRAASNFADHFGVRVHRSGGSLPLPSEVQVLEIPGAAPEEIALHSSRDGGILIIGDALINFGSHGFDFLPAKYCSDSRVMRQSLRRLLELDFDCMVFAHGDPIMSHARERLASLLDAS